ncbi:MAG: nucleotide sugar dehydrogenase [bacterium]|nr:nucleotide sugar dehydrogenase [bacterium]MDT8366971.1 nucleotide sugar dehydrogenase [bacterium]
MSHKQELQKKIEDRTAVCCIIGLGYVGLPLAVELAATGFTVYGIDLNTNKVEAVNRGESYIPDVSNKMVKEGVDSGKLKATTDFSVVKDCDVVSICVPTPLNKTRDPDISYIISALEVGIVPHVHPGMLVVLESTTYPGTTEEVIVPALISGNLKVGEDIFVAFSPERVDPGNPHFQTGNIPKVVGGMTKNCCHIATLLYSSFLAKVHPVSSAAVAEMVKIHENTFRSVNIALVNELALMCDRLGIDVWEVIEGASTKPFGFMPFYPGPGLGGHCIPIDPYYLSWKARSVGFEARFIELAGQVNSSMPMHVVNKASDALNSVGKALRGSNVLILGVAYKSDIDDERESPAIDIIDRLIAKGAMITYLDSYIPELDVGTTVLSASEISLELLQETDLAIIVTAHSDFDYDFILEQVPLILDTRNAIKSRQDKVWRI